MSTIIIIQIGNSGNKVGYSLLEQLMIEHNINEEGIKNDQNQDNCQNENLNVFFREIKNNQYKLRSLLIDIESSTIDTLLASHKSNMYPEDNIICANYNGPKTWVECFNSLESDFLEITMDALRNEIESCDIVPSILILNTLGASISGFTSKLMQSINQEYLTIMAAQTVFPNKSMSSQPIEYMNSIFSLFYMIDQEWYCFPNDITSLQRVNTKQLNFQTTNVNDYYSVQARSLLDITSSIRFPGLNSQTLRKLFTNLNVFPSFRFYKTTITGLTDFSLRSQQFSAKELALNIFSDDSNLCEIPAHYGRFWTGSLIFRGKFCSSQLENLDQYLTYMKGSYIVEVLPHKFGIAHTHVPPQLKQYTASTVSVHTCTGEYFKHNIIDQVKPLIKRKAYCHLFDGDWYNEFDTKINQILGVVDDYKRFQDCDPFEQYEEYE